MTPFGILITAIVRTFGWLEIMSISEAVTVVMWSRNNAELKMDLLARGYSSDEIVRVVQAGEESKAATKSAQSHMQNPTTNAAQMS